VSLRELRQRFGQQTNRDIDRTSIDAKLLVCRLAKERKRGRASRVSNAIRKRHGLIEQPKAIPNEETNDLTKSSANLFKEEEEEEEEEDEERESKVDGRKTTSRKNCEEEKEEK
jgi:hypothetical protein